MSSLKAQLEKEIAERERERAHTRQQIEHLQETLTLAQEAQNKAMLLLEHRTIGGGDWEKAFKALETRIAKQETTAARMAELKMAAKREAIEEIKSKAWWQVVFDLKGE